MRLEKCCSIFHSREYERGKPHRRELKGARLCGGENDREGREGTSRLVYTSLDAQGLYVYLTILPPQIHIFTGTTRKCVYEGACPAVLDGKIGWGEYH
jgi:hypothetical protein